MTIESKTLGIVFAGLGLLLVIVLALVKVNFDSQAVFLCEAVESDPNLNMAQCPAHTSNVPWLLMIGFGISFLVLGVGIYLLFTKKEPHALENKEVSQERPVDYAPVDLSKLNEEEMLIYTLLKEHKGTLYQSDLIKHTGHSKVKMTRLLDKLEHQKILERKRRGMSNIIVLK